MRKSLTALAGEYLSLAFVLPGSTFVGYVIGHLLDRLLKTHFLYIVFLILGIVSGFVQLIRKVQQDTRDDGA